MSIMHVRAARPVAMVGLMFVLLVSGACTGSTGGAGKSSAASVSGGAAGSEPAGPTSDGAGSSPAGETSGPGKSAEPGVTELEQSLDDQSGGKPHVLVSVSEGYEAATYDQEGGINFWANTGATASWTQIGASTYPVNPQAGSTDATVAGARLDAMRHATFIVRGVFTGDGSGNAVAFTTGAKGWGAIIAERNGNIGPSGRPVGKDLIGLSYDFGFVDGHLQTKDCPKNRPFSECGEHPVVKLWNWTGTDFRVQ